MYIVVVVLKLCLHLCTYKLRKSKLLIWWMIEYKHGIQLKKEMLGYKRAGANPIKI
jgi:hypothetical protein